MRLKSWLHGRMPDSRRFFHEMPIKAIATLLKRFESTIKTHLSNARLQLRELLTPYLQNRDHPWFTS